MQSMTPKQAIALCLALIANSSGESCLEEGDGTSMLQLNLPRAKHHVQHKRYFPAQLLQTAHEITNKVNARDDPAGCSQASGAAREAVEAALPAIAEEHTHLVNQIRIAADAVENCATRDVDGSAMVMQQGSNLLTARASHADCRQSENDLQGGLVACDEFAQLRSSLGNQQCFALPDEDGWVLAVQTARDGLETALNQAQPLQERCTAARAALADKQTECASEQRRFEEDYCAHRASCTGLQTCRISSEESYMAVQTEVQSALETLRSELQKMKHVECLLGMSDRALAQGSIISEDVVGSCSELASTAELDIDYPVFDSLTTCESTILTRSPCGAAFFQAEYQDLAERDAIQAACTECSALSLVGDAVPGLLNSTHYYAVNSWPEHAWGAYDSEARASSIEKCLLKEQTEDADGSGYLFTSCCTSDGDGMRRDCGSTRNTNWDTAIAQCASQGGRLCTADEAMSQVTVGKGCSVDGPSSATGADLNRLWTSTPCTLESPVSFKLVKTDTKCPHDHGHRLFRDPARGTSDITLGQCHAKCLTTAGCAHFSHGEHHGGHVCMGCTTLVNAPSHAGFNVYDIE